MSNTRLAIVQVAQEGLVTIVNDHGPCTNEEFVKAYGIAYQAQQDWDLFFDALLELLMKEAFLTDQGLTTAGYTLGSLLQFVRDNVDAFMPGKKDLKTRTLISLLEPAIRLFGEGKTIAINLDEMRGLMDRLDGPVMRQLLRDGNRRDIVRPAMPTRVLLYENPPTDN